MLDRGDLRRSIRKAITKNLLIVSSDTPYSAIHNDGQMVNIRITKRSRRWFWYMYKKTGVDMWRGLALTKKQSIQFKMPKRQFMGHSDFLMKRIEMQFNYQLNEIIKRDL